MNEHAVLSLLDRLYQGQDLQQSQVNELFGNIVQGKLDDILIASLLTALKIKGETPVEIAGAAGALIDNATPFPRPDYHFADIVGTGGDGHDTINISSASAIVAAGCGVKVAKHGNRSVSSQSGSADLFRTFGMNLDMSPDTARQCLDLANLCFLFAPNYHAGIKYAMPVRTRLKTRTVFNLLGPLANPARPTHMMVGVYSPDLIEPFAHTLKLLGYQKAMVVHGSGLDEFALHGPSKVAIVDGEEIKLHRLTPADFNLTSAPLEAIKGGAPEHNKALIQALLSGRGEPAHANAVAMNAGALLVLCGKANNYAEGAQMALELIASGSAIETINNAAKISQEAPQT